MSIESVRGTVLNGGRVTGLPPHLVGLNESPDCVDIDPSDYRGASSRPGSAQFGTSFTTASGGSAIGAFHWTRNNGSIYLLAAHSGTLYDIGSGGTWASFFSNIIANGRVGFGALNNQVVVAGQGTGLYISSDASVFTAIGAGTYLPAEGRYTAVWKSKLWVAGDPSNPQRVSFSASNDPTDFTTANNSGNITIGAGDGDIINGLLATTNALIVFKRKKVYAVFGDTPVNFNVFEVHSSGLSSELGYAAGDRLGFFVSDDGVYSISGGNTSKISNKNKQDFDDISDKTKIHLACSGDKLFITAYAESSPYSLVLDYKRGVWSKYAAQPFKGYALSRDNKLYAITNASTMQAYQVDTGTSGSISPYWATPDIDSGDMSVLKTLQQYYFHMKPATATTSLTVRHYANGASTGNDSTLTFGTTAEHDIQRAHGQSMKGRFFRLRATWTGDRTLYGYQIYADVRADGVPGRSDS